MSFTLKLNVTGFFIFGPLLCLFFFNRIKQQTEAERAKCWSAVEAAALRQVQRLLGRDNHPTSHQGP